MTTFKPGFDPRREVGGRPPSQRSIQSRIRQTLGRDTVAICEQIAIQARSGDPHALLAAAVLLAHGSTTIKETMSE